MIYTKEGFVKKRGDKVWEIGICNETSRYTPTISKVGHDLVNEKECWHSYESCLARCKEINKSKIEA